MMNSLPDIVGVYCTWLEAMNEDPRTFARVLGGQAFCSACGATDHRLNDGQAHDSHIRHNRWVADCTGCEDEATENNDMSWIESMVCDR